MGFGYGGQQVMDGDVQEAHAERAEVGVFPRGLYCLGFSLPVALSPLTICHLCFATMSVYYDLTMPRLRNSQHAQQPFALFLTANTH